MKLFVRLLLALALAGGLLPITRSRADSPSLSAPTNLSARVDMVGGKPVVHLQWSSPTPGFRYYFLVRDGHPYSYATSPSFSDTHVNAGETHSYTVSILRWPQTGASASVTITVPFPTPPAPAGLKAAGQWVTSCPKCSGMAMAHIVLTWNAVSAAQSYKVYRNGTLLDAVQTPAETDMSVKSGQTYIYTVCAVSPNGLSPQSASASATAPNPPVSVVPPTPMPMPGPMPPTTMAGFTAPTNLAVRSVWQGGPVDTLTWDAVPGATSYNVYQYEKLIAKGVSGTSYTVPMQLFNGSMTYAVTAVDADCNCESIPSNIAGAGSIVDPNAVPSWVSHVAPPVPQFVTATPEWNGGMPRIHVTWTGDGGAQVYSVYRDGQKVAAGMWGLSWFDNKVQPGESHTYAVSSVNTFWPGSAESAPSAAVTATAPTAAPAPLSQKVEIVSVLPDDNSATVFFKPVPGALDYRVYDVTNPGMVKYAGWAGTGLCGDMIKNGIPALPPPSVISIQWNGITAATGANLVVEAVDKLGPFQTSDGMMGPGAMNMSGGMNVAINGQGDPSDLPLTLAKSDVFHVSCQSHALAGDQAFYDNFTSDLPFTAATPEPVVAAESNSFSEVQDVQNDKWRIRTIGADTQMTQAFVMNNHFMDTLYDGPTAATAPFSHNNNASLIMMPKATADISGDKVLHVSFEVDAHFDGRRWCDVFVGEAGDPLLHAAPTKLDGALPTVKGNLFVWQILGNEDAELIQPQSPGSSQNVITDLSQAKDWNDGEGTARDIYGQVFGFHKAYANGSPQNLDKRSRFDLYLSRTHYKVVETEPDGVTQIVREMDFPKGVTLPFTKCQVYFVHELYHTGNDRPENLGERDSAYWVNNRPYSDERHWDNMGQEVLAAFPGNPSGNQTNP